MLREWDCFRVFVNFVNKAAKLQLHESMHLKLFILYYLLTSVRE